MRPKKFFGRLSWVAWASWLTACSPKVVDVQLKIITAACVAPSPLEKATHFRVKITGDDLEPLISVTELATSNRSLLIPNIPAGSNRVVEVRAYNGVPGENGQVISLGKSKTFDVPAQLSTTNSKVAIDVVLRRVNVFVPPNSTQNPSTCSKMITARAGHTATLLPDGKVFIAGGYDKQGAKNTAMYKAEWYNPETGLFEDVQDVGLVGQDASFTPVPLAFHSANLLPTGQVILWGGKEFGKDNESIVRARKLLFDPEQKLYRQVTGEAVNIGRASHSAVVDKNGRLLVVGGETVKAGDTKTVLEDRIETMDASTAKVTVLPDVRLGRKEAGLATVQQGAFVAVVGGYDGTQLLDEVVFFEFNGTTFVRADTTLGPRLAKARRAAAVARFQNDNNLIVLGGYNDASLPKGLESTEIITTGDSRKIASGPSIVARGELCAAALPDGRVLAIGGRTLDGSLGGLPKSDGTTEMISSSDSGAQSVETLEPLKISRYQHSCTVLKDGSVLVLGGLAEEKGTQTVLQDAYLFVPAPLD